MDKELKELSETLLTIYQNNLEFLKENFLDLYERVEKLSKDIDSEEHISKYSLEYKDGYFDILNLENNSWFYGTNSYEDADNRVKHSNFSKDGSYDLLRKGISGKKLAVSQSLKNVMPIIEQINKMVDFEDIKFRQIYKFVFMGIGLGFHADSIFKKLDPFVTMIIEPELEIFRLSLFTIEYSKFNEGNKTLFLSIEDSKLERINNVNQFYHIHNYMNYNVKHHLLIENYRYIDEELKDFFASNSSIYFPYTSVLQNIHRTAGFIKNKERFLNVKLLHEKKILKDKEVLIVSAGPSLDNYIEWIKIHQDKFIIICVDVIVQKLEKNFIIPDIVFSIDPSYLCGKYLTTQDPNYLDSSAIVFLSQQEESVIDVVKGKNYYFAQSIDFIKDLGYLGSVSNVGAYSFAMAVHFGATKLYTIGNDAAFNQETGGRYASDSACTQSDNIELVASNDDLVSSYDVVEVDGNLRDKVKTTRRLLTFKDSFEHSIHSLQGYYKFEVYNLSDGVRMEDFEPMDMDTIDKKVVDFKTKKMDISSSLDSITQVIEDLDSEEDIKIINRIIKRVKKHKTKKITSRDNFLERKLDLMIWILTQNKSMSSSMFGNIFLLYTGLIDLYINFILNLDQSELHTKENLTKINVIWIDGMIHVFKDMKKAIK
ncbi:MAG: 6-hydroxymethylpterin diphosphokinase MptE-like protein [Campylobacterota bacterium]|nr:6-hydroxymethylpterin diphosphokinase MptE-like protein [Campylobacterota bacterium]